MPFRTFTWENGSAVLGDRTPDPELRQIDEDTFVLLRSFCYRAGRGDPDEGVVFLVPGEDFDPPRSPSAARRGHPARHVRHGRISPPCRRSSGGSSRATEITHAASLLRRCRTSTTASHPSRAELRTPLPGSAPEPGPQKEARSGTGEAAVSAFGTMSLAPRPRSGVRSGQSLGR